MTLSKRSHLWGITIPILNMPKTPVHGCYKAAFFLFLMGFKSALYTQIIRDSPYCDNTNEKLQDTSSCSEVRPLPAASQQNQNENMTLTAAANFNIFILPVHCSSRLVSVSMSNTDFMHLWLGSTRSIQTVSWPKICSTGKQPPTCSVVNYSSNHKGLKFS